MARLLLLLLLLSTSYSAQVGMAAPSAMTKTRGSVGKHLTPRQWKSKQALELLVEAFTAEDHRWYNFQSLMQEDSPTQTFLRGLFDRYIHLRPVKLNVKNVVEHFYNASHAELDRIIAVFRVDARELLPHMGRLTEEEVVNMAEETSAFNLRNFSDTNFEELSTSFEELSKSKIDGRSDEEFAYYVQAAAEVVSMVADGHAGVISGFQVLYAAGELDKMDEVLLAAWRKHYQALSDEQLRDTLGDFFDMKRGFLTRIQAIVSGESEELARVFEGGTGRNAEKKRNLGEIIRNFDKPAGRRAAVEYLSQRRVPSGVFRLYDSAHEYGGIAHDGNISAKYHAALTEIELVTSILVAVRGLNEREMRYLARQLKKATKQVER